MHQHYSHVADSDDGGNTSSPSYGSVRESFMTPEKFQRALSQMDQKTSALHKKLNLVYVSLLGFVFIGMCALGCVVFGVVEIVGGDSVFENEGFGEVLTVLGTYFSIPYVFVVGLFLVVTMDNLFSRWVGEFISSFHQQIVFSGVVALYIFQAAITNYYMSLLTSNYALAISVFDVCALVMIVLYHKTDGRGYIFGTLLFAIKCAVLWGPAWETVDTESYWGPNGILSMLFLSIPMCEFPIMASYVQRAKNVVGKYSQAGDSAASDIISDTASNGYAAFNSPTNNQKSNQTSEVGTQSRFMGISARAVQMAEAEFVDHFVSHFGLYLNHVMHTLDLITLFNFAFIAPTTNEKQKEAPLPFRILIAILFCIGFFANHAAMIHLFYNREDVHVANVPFVQPIIKVANRSMRAEASGSANPDLDPKKSYQRRLFQYMLLMLAVVDVPLLICRLELWAGQYAALSIFVAKNIKDIVDVAMLTTRVNENIRENESLGGGIVSGQEGGLLAGNRLVPVQPMREPSL